MDTGIQTVNHRGPFITTVSGRRLYLLDPGPEAISIEDIAHHLSMSCRFTGAMRGFYSVAQHSCLVHDLAPSRLQKVALLHDAAEAYIGDINSPLKSLLRPLLEPIEGRIERLIADIYGFPASDFHYVKPFDNEAYEWEEKVRRNGDFVLMEPTPTTVLAQWRPNEAEEQFMGRFKAVWL